MPNPYTIRPVDAPDYFAQTRGSRGMQAHRILQNVCRADPLPDSISLVGERRFGKTSLLHYLYSQSLAKSIPNLHIVYIDMLGLNPPGSATFYEMLDEQLGPIANTPILSYRDFRGFLLKLRKPGQRLVLLIDEFDLVVRDQRFDLSFFDNLRSAATTLPLALIVASVQPLTRIAHQAVYGSPFFNIFQEERLRPLSVQEVQALITQPAGGERGLGEIRDEIIVLAGYHPYFLQLICHCAWNLREETNDKLDQERLQTTFQTMARNQYQYIWDHCSSHEQHMLQTLAQGNVLGTNEGASLIERGYIIDGTPMRICGTGLASFILMQDHSLPQITDQSQLQDATTHNPVPGSTDLNPTIPATIFYSYAHEDDHFRLELEKHLSNLKQQGLVISWHDRQIVAGDEWSQAIDDHLNNASVILLLISPDFLASDYCYSKEMQRAMERHQAREAIVIPIILRHVDWHNTPFGKLQALPPEGKPIRAWSDRDLAFLAVARGIRMMIEQFHR